MNILHSNKKVAGLLVFALGLAVSCLGLGMHPSKAAAAGETYSLTGSDKSGTVTVSGGDLKGSSALKYSGTETNYAILDYTYAGKVTHKTGCTFTMTVDIAPLDNSQGQIDHITNSTCSQSITQPYLAQSVAIHGAAASSGNITVINIAAPDQSNPPASETVTIKSSDGSKTYSTATQNLNGSAADKSYGYFNFQNPNNGATQAFDGEACSKILATCKKFHKEKGISLSVDFSGTACDSGNAPGANGVCAKGDSNGDSAVDCGGGDFDWIACPVINLAVSGAGKLDDLIHSLLTLDVTQTFGGDNTTGYYTAWNSFRILATALLVIAGLVMVVSEALGFEFLDAYTIRKVLPRLLVAVIGISLSWPVMKFVVEFFNVFGNDVQGLIQGPFSSIHGTFNTGIGIGTTLTAILGTVALAAVFGPAALLFIVSAFISLLIALFILVVRQIGVTLAVILAPLAIACYILPNTQRVWNLWRENFLGLLMMFPIVVAFITAGHVFAVISLKHGGGISQVIGLIAYFAPYFLLPLAFRLATGIISNLSGMVNDRSKGVFDRMRKTRQERAATNVAAMRAGNRLKGDGVVSRAFNASTRNTANLSNAGVNPLRMRSRMQSAAATHSQAEVAEYMEKNAAFSSIKGNDDYLQATSRSMGGGRTEADWRRYLSNVGYSGQALEQGVAQIREARRQAPNEVFERAALMANASTGTGWKEGGPAAMMEDINEVAGNDRHSAATMLAQMRGMAGQSGRLDLAGSGFGAQVSAMNRMYEPDRNGNRMSREEANDAVLEGALFTKGPGEYARARGQAVANMATQMRTHLQRSHEAVNAAHATGNIEQITKTERALAQDYAALDNLHDNLNHMSPENAKIIADSVLSQPVSAGSSATIMDQIKALQNGSASPVMNAAYGDTRKSYDQKQYQAQQNRPTDTPES